ncbi:MAG: lactoylglutathione lyase [Colwellia sp.]|nr:lactoylglutathione lyase [Colwellia sp.]
MKVDDIRVFIPSKDYEVSQSFYQALGFEMDYVTDDLSLFQNGECTFFLQNFYNEELAKNLMLQLCVLDINEALETISNLNGFDIKYEPIKSEPWGQVVYLWGPAGELWHITELRN